MRRSPAHCVSPISIARHTRSISGSWGWLESGLKAKPRNLSTFPIERTQRSTGTIFVMKSQSLSGIALCGTLPQGRVSSILAFNLTSYPAAAILGANSITLLRRNFRVAASGFPRYSASFALTLRALDIDPLPSTLSL